MACGRANLSSSSPSQNLADSLLHFVNNENNDCISFCESESTQENSINNPSPNNNINKGEQTAMPNDDLRHVEYLQLNGERLLWKDSLETLKNLMLQLQEQGKWSSPGGEAKRFKSTDKRLEMTWYGSKKQTLTFSGDEGQRMREKLIALANMRLRKETINTKSVLQKDSEINIENKSSTKNSNEGDYYMQVPSTLDTLQAKIDNFEQQFKNFQSKTNNNIDILFTKLERNPDAEDEKEIDRLREENCKLKSDNAKLTHRLNEHVNTISELNNIIKVAGDEKASLLTAIRLIQSDDINVRSNNNESQVWTRIESKTQGKTKNQTPSRRINQASNQILEQNQYASLAVDESNENKDMEHNVTPSSTHTENSTKSGRRIQHQKEKQRHSVEPKQQHNASSSKSTEGPIAILGDSMLKKLSPSRLRRSTGKKIIVKTFPGATTSDMKHYIKPTLEKNPQLVVIHVGTNDIQHKEPEEIAKEVESLCRTIMVDGLSKVAISEIIQRADDKLNTNVKKTNVLLAKVCKNNNWSLISNSDINTSSLNASGLHLNDRGAAILAKNYIDFLRK